MNFDGSMITRASGKKILASDVAKKGPSKKEQSIEKIARERLPISLDRTPREIQTLLDKISSEEIEGTTELSKSLTCLFAGIEGRKARGHIYDVANAIAETQLHKVLEHSLPLVTHIVDGSQRAAVLRAVGDIPEKDRSNILKYAIQFVPSVTDGYHLASIIRVVQAVPKLQRAMIFRKAQEALKLAQDGLHVAAILRAVHTTMSQDVIENLCYSVGDPQVEILLQEWDLMASAVTAKQSRELAEIESEICEKGIPDCFQVCEISEDVGLGLFATKKIKKGSVIGLYTGVLELVPKSDQGQSSYVYNLTTNLSKESFNLSSEQMYYVTRVSMDEEGIPKIDSFKRDLFVVQVNAEPMGNYTRRINHGQACNVSPELVQLDNGRIEVMLIASQAIQAGDQLLLDYGSNYWKALGIQPVEIEPDRYRLEDGHIVEKRKVIEEKPEKVVEEDPVVRRKSKRKYSVLEDHSSTSLSETSFLKSRRKSSLPDKRQPVPTAVYQEYRSTFSS